MQTNRKSEVRHDPAAYFKLSYGLFVLTACEGDKDNGCIVNTVQQLTSSPARITVAVNKQNFTHDMIVRTGIFNISVLDESADFDIFKRFGFASGRDTDKFADKEIFRTSNGVSYINENTAAVFSASVAAMHDYGTHTLFIAEVTHTSVLSDIPAATYAYYFANIKPKPVSEKPSGKVYICKICGYEYDGEKEGIAFEELSEDWVCPLCKHPKSDFEVK